jgi:hypothetical protein
LSAPGAVARERSSYRRRNVRLGDAGGQLADALRSAGVRDVRTRAVAHTIGAAHPYARLPLAFAASLEPLWRQSGLVGGSELAALRAAVEAGLGGDAAVTTTFTLIQAWGRR